MINGIRRRFAQSIGKEAWSTDLDQELEQEPELEHLAPSTDSLPEQLPLPITRFNADSMDITEYYTSLVRAAIAQGGKFGDHEISVPWLRMTLAGLEGRHIQLEVTWDGIEAPGTNAHPESNESPSYRDLFPDEAEAQRNTVLSWD